MSFHHEPEIPGRQPLPHDVPAARASGPTLQQRTNAAFVRMAIINGAILLAAVLAVYVLGLVPHDWGIWVIVAAAVVTGLHTTMVVTQIQAMRTAELRAAGASAESGADWRVAAAPGVSDAGVQDAQIQDAQIQDAQVHDAPVHDGATWGSPTADSTPFTLEVEDVFSITGRGTVATGVVAHGEVAVGDTVTIYRGELVVAGAVVTGIEAFRRTQETASAGDRVGLLLRGVSREEIARGDRVVA